jgi:NADH pyrophosphatase NudC (nudix superfamily)
MAIGFKWRARFLADVIGGDLNPDGYETLDVRWFDVNDLPPMVRVIGTRWKSVEIS